MTPVDELRAAAAKLRADRFYGDLDVPLADLLDDIADWWTSFDLAPDADHPALLTARTINRSTP